MIIQMHFAVFVVVVTAVVMVFFIPLFLYAIFLVLVLRSLTKLHASEHTIHVYGNFSLLNDLLCELL